MNSYLRYLIKSASKDVLFCLGILIKLKFSALENMHTRYARARSSF